MRNYDIKHIAYHTLVGLYFIWLIVFCILISMTIGNVISNGVSNFSRMLMVWILLNLVMGISLYMVLRLFKKVSLTARLITYTFYGVVIGAVITLVYISAGV